MPSSLRSVAMSKSMTCSKLPPFREKLCWVRWGHWCKGRHLNKKHIPGAGWHFLYTYQIRGLSRAHQASPLPPKLFPADWWEQLRGSWMGTRQRRVPPPPANASEPEQSCPSTTPAEMLHQRKQFTRARRPCCAYYSELTLGEIQLRARECTDINWMK